MKKSILIFLFVGLTSSAQQIQWASKVIKFSTDLGGKQNGIKRILGKPDAFPQGGSSPNAWTPKNALDGWEFVTVGFENPQTVKQIAVFENLNAGCVTRILVDNGSGKFETVWSRKKDWATPSFKSTIMADRAYYYNRKRRKIQTAPDVSINAGIEYAILENAVANVIAVKIEFNFALIPGQKQIDAIGISDSETPIEVSINSNQAFENILAAEKINFGNLDISAPALSKDGNKLYFTTSGSSKDVIYSSYKANGKWSMPTEEVLALNDNETFNHLEAITDNFMLKGGAKYDRGTGECGYELLVSKDGKYFSDGLLKIMAYNNFDDTSDATISSDGTILILGVESDFTQGGSDLYVAKRKPDGTYSLLENFGKIANSAADENMPFLLSDNKTLLFCSNGFSCYGDYDIYVTTRLDDSWKKWSEPINLGSKINGSGFDGSPFYDENTQTLYFVKSTGGKNDLYTANVPLSALTKN